MFDATLVSLQRYRHSCSTVRQFHDIHGFATVTSRSRDMRPSSSASLIQPYSCRQVV